MIAFFQTGKDAASLSFRMDGLYGLDWITNLLREPDSFDDLLNGLKTRNEREREETGRTEGGEISDFTLLSMLRHAFRYLLPQLLPLLLSEENGGGGGGGEGEEEEEEEVAQDLSDLLERERRVALEVLSSLLITAKFLGINSGGEGTGEGEGERTSLLSLQQQEEVFSHIAQNLHLYFPESKRQLLIAPKSNSGNAKRLDILIIQECVMNLLELTSPPLWKVIEEEVIREVMSSIPDPSSTNQSYSPRRRSESRSGSGARLGSGATLGVSEEVEEKAGPLPPESSSPSEKVPLPNFISLESGEEFSAFWIPQVEQPRQLKKVRRR
jgi:hypothetical protein